MVRRLAAAAVVVVALVACGKDDGGGAPTSRVNAAKTAPKKTGTAAAFCDTMPDREHAPAFTPPELASGALPITKTWRWINVWATWCKPCVDELPRLVKWQAKLAAAGQPVELQFVSIDESEEDLVAYRQLHPETPASLRLAKPEAQAAWFTALGLDAAAPIPVHVFVDASDHVRCVRAGGVREQDYAAVTALLR